MQRVSPRPPINPTPEKIDAFWAARREWYVFVNRVRADALLIANGHEIVPLTHTLGIVGLASTFTPETMESPGGRPENGAPVAILKSGFVADDGTVIVKAVVYEPGVW